MTRRDNQDVLVNMINRKKKAVQEEKEQEQAERWIQQKCDEEYRRRVEAERKAFAQEREAIVLERKKGTGVLAGAEQPTEATVQHGRRAGSASSQRSASVQAPW